MIYIYIYQIYIKLYIFNLVFFCSMDIVGNFGIRFDTTQEAKKCQHICSLSCSTREENLLEIIKCAFSKQVWHILSVAENLFIVCQAP